MTYRIYYDMDRETLIVVYAPCMDPTIDTLYFTFYDGVGEGTVNGEYLENNCQLVLECEGDLKIVGDQIEEILH